MCRKYLKEFRDPPPIYQNIQIGKHRILKVKVINIFAHLQFSLKQNTERPSKTGRSQIPIHSTTEVPAAVDQCNTITEFIDNYALALHINTIRTWLLANPGVDLSKNSSSLSTYITPVCIAAQRVLEEVTLFLHLRCHKQ